MLGRITELYVWITTTLYTSLYAFLFFIDFTSFTSKHEHIYTTASENNDTAFRNWEKVIEMETDFIVSEMLKHLLNGNNQTLFYISTVLPMLCCLHKMQWRTAPCSRRRAPSSKTTAVRCLPHSETSLLHILTASVPQRQQKQHALQPPPGQKHPVCLLHTIKTSALFWPEDVFSVVWSLKCN